MLVLLSWTDKCCVEKDILITKKTALNIHHQDPNRSYLIGSHPHGLLCSGAFCAFATDALDFNKLFPGLTPRYLFTLRGAYLCTKVNRERYQSDQFWRVIRLWPTFKCFWQHLICPHFWASFIDIWQFFLVTLKVSHLSNCKQSKGVGLSSRAAQMWRHNLLSPMTSQLVIRNQSNYYN